MCVRAAQVLVAFAAHDPGTGYCQGLNNVAALLLLNSGKAGATALTRDAGCSVSRSDGSCAWQPLEAEPLEARTNPVFSIQVTYPGTFVTLPACALTTRCLHPCV
eukprot:357723-Chlamydomonas_euryale.AAC.19